MPLRIFFFFNPASKKTNILITPAFIPVSNWADTRSIGNYISHYFLQEILCQTLGCCREHGSLYRSLRVSKALNAATNLTHSEVCKQPHNVQLKPQEAIKATMLLETMWKSKTRLLRKQVSLKLSLMPKIF